MLPNYRIVPLNIRDLPNMMQIERRVFNDPWSAAMIKDSMMAAHSSIWGIVLQSGDLIAFGVLSVVLDESEILSIVVAEKYQNQGYGSILMKFLINKAKVSKAEKMFLDVRANNKKAIYIYEKKFNFKKINVRKNYYREKNNTFNDAYIYELNLK